MVFRANNVHFPRGMMRRGLSGALIALMLTSCATFIEEEEIDQLKKYEEKLYIIKDTVTVGKYSLDKGQQIKLLIKVGDDSIKVYGYSAAKGFLKADRVLILYLFDDSFKNSRYDKMIFEKKLYALVAPKD
jgi:type II secretion system-associated lipoprotein